jgi:hypothetical protein
MAEMMVDQGKEVSIVTQFMEVAPFCQNTLEGPNLQRLLHEKNIGQHLLHWIEDMTVDNSVKMSLAHAYRDGSEIVMPPKTGEMPRRHRCHQSGMRYGDPVHGAEIKYGALYRA